MYIITWDDNLNSNNHVITDTWDMVHTVNGYLCSESGKTLGARHIRVVDGNFGFEMNLVSGMPTERSQ